jgi:CubicO group peptidase (beta-lactamase class C family)
MDQQAFDSVIGDLEDSIDKDGRHLALSSVIVSQDRMVFSHYFTADETVDIRSIAKPIVCLAIGAAIERGLWLGGVRVDLTTRVWPLLSKYATISDPTNMHEWNKVILMDLFRITLGHDKGLMFSADVKGRDENRLVDYVVNYPVTGAVGRDFVYSNAGTFLVSSLITEYLGFGVDALVDELLFRPMGIVVDPWKRYGKYCAACTGLRMKNQDLQRIGRLIADGGVYEGKQLVPKRWVDTMRQPHVAAPTHRYVAGRAFPKWSYGLNLWICEDRNYYCDGTDGQYMIVIPARDLVITTLGHQADTEPVSKCLGKMK